MSDYLISIIIPVYNVSPYLRKCLNSIVCQLTTEIEVLIIDDGSTDSSSTICDEYAGDQIRVFHKDNGGLSDARNFGLKRAKGTYIIFIDSDDFINERCLRNVVKCAHTNCYPDVIFLNCYKYYEDNDSKIEMGNGITAKVNEMNSEALYNYLGSLPKYPASAWSKAIKRSLLLDNRLYFKKGLLCEDLEWSARLYSVIKSAVYCDNPYYYYRQARTNSISNTKSAKKVFHQLYSFEKMSEKEKRYMLYSFAEYILRTIVLDYSILSYKQKAKVKKTIKNYSCVLGTRKDKKSQAICLSINVLGVDITSHLLKLALMIREKTAYFRGM